MLTVVELSAPPWQVQPLSPMLPTPVGNPFTFDNMRRNIQTVTHLLMILR